MGSKPMARTNQPGFVECLASPLTLMPVMLGFGGALALWATTKPDSDNKLPLFLAGVGCLMGLGALLSQWMLQPSFNPFLLRVFAILFVLGFVLVGPIAAFWFLLREPGLADKGKAYVSPKGTPAKPKGTPIKLALDSFSGYCVFRSAAFKEKLAERKLSLVCSDDGADYSRRMQSIKRGDTPYAVFTIDALINQTPREAEPPATIVMVIDETRGADAMVAYEAGVPTLNAMNSPWAKVVLVPDSPSETLLRFVRSQFNLNELPNDRKQYVVTAQTAEQVYQQFVNARPTEPTAYVLWEPYVTLALKEKGAKRLIDSSRFKGMIVDVLVVQTAYLRNHPDEVKSVVRAYLEVLHEAQNTDDGLTRMVKLDAEIINEPRVAANAEAVVKGIWWKNTMENYAHFGLLPEVQAAGVQQLYEMIKNITALLEHTKHKDEPNPGLNRLDKLFDDGILRQLSGQRPRPFNFDEGLRKEDDGSAIAAMDWTKLKEVGQLKVADVPFTLTGKLQPEAEEALAELARNLEQWPNYYLRIEGNTTSEGDPEDNTRKAQQRAETVKHYLVEQFKIPAARLQARGNEPGGGKKVGFVFLEQP
jgi:outer membrane protein OmpA-like peptidoglycan-associated protein